MAHHWCRAQMKRCSSACWHCRAHVVLLGAPQLWLALACWFAGPNPLSYLLCRSCFCMCCSVCDCRVYPGSTDGIMLLAQDDLCRLQASCALVVQTTITQPWLVRLPLQLLVCYVYGGCASACLCVAHVLPSAIARWLRFVTLSHCQLTCKVVLRSLPGLQRGQQQLLGPSDASEPAH